MVNFIGMASGSIIGVDLGGTKIVVASYDAATFEVQASEKVPTGASRGFAHVLEDVIGLIEKLRAPDTTAVGIGVAGLIRQPRGVLINAPNIKDAIDIPVKKLMEDRLKLPVHVDNDANCFALAEARMGAGRDGKVVIGLTLGTGVGGGIVIDGNIFHGADGFAGEIGHMLLQPGQPPYETEDKRGEVEQFLSGTAMGNRCPEAKDPSEYLHGAVCSFLHPKIFREAAWLCVSLTYLLNPSVIVFGGSAGNSLMGHLHEVEDEVRKWMLPGTPLPPLAKAQLKDPGVLGAALLCK